MLVNKKAANRPKEAIKHRPKTIDGDFVMQSEAHGNSWMKEFTVSYEKGEAVEGRNSSQWLAD